MKEITTGWGKLPAALAFFFAPLFIFFMTCTCGKVLLQGDHAFIEDGAEDLPVVEEIEFEMGQDVQIDPAEDDIQQDHQPSAIAVSISVGDMYTCALMLTGGIKCWGFNGYGQHGDGTATDSSIPVDVTGLSSGVLHISAGDHTCALMDTGGVKCWGRNSEGQIGNGTTSGLYEGVATPVDVLGLLSGVAVVSAGLRHTCALMEMGSIKCWGSNNYGQLGDGTNTDRPTPVDVVGLSSGVMAVSAGWGHTCAIMDSGGLKCWGVNYWGDLGDGTSEIDDGTMSDKSTPVDVIGLSSGVARVSAGSMHTCAIMETGNAKCWGRNTSGQLGIDMMHWSSTPCDVYGLSSGVVTISAGYEHTCAVMDTGCVKCWGDNQYGQLGNGTMTNSPTPIDVLGISSGATDVSTGYDHTCVLMSTGGVKCWGNNTFGQLGNGTTTNSSIPMDVIFE